MRQRETDRGIANVPHHHRQGSPCGGWYIRELVEIVADSLDGLGADGTIDLA